jgi:hypothetical protein
VLSAVFGIAPGCCSPALLTQVNSLQATNSISGIEVSNTGNLVLEDISGLGYAVQNADGALIVNSSGTITVDDAVTTGRRIALFASGAGSDVVINANLAAGSGGGAPTQLYADDAITQASGTLVTATGDIDIAAGGIASLAAISTANSVIINAGSVTDSNGATTNISADYLNISAAQGVSLDTQVNVLYVDNATAGNIDIAETDGLQLQWAAAPNQTVTLDGGSGGLTNLSPGSTNVLAVS